MVSLLHRATINNHTYCLACYCHCSVFGQPFVKRFTLCYQTVVCHVCPVCDVGVLWPNGWMDEDATWYGGRPRPRRLLDGDPAPPPQKGGRGPQFSPHVYCGQTAGLIKMTLGTEVGLGAGHIALHGDPASLPKKGQSPQFRPMSIVAKRLYVSGYHLVRR